MPDAILLAGPTASGKSRLALDLGRRHDAIIVNADAMQVYAELGVLTARPSAEDEAAVPHRLYGHVSAATRYSVGRWLTDVAAVLDEARRAGRRPIVVGGTGLYFKALSEGLAAVPPIPAAVRQQLSAATADLDTAGLHARLAAIDPKDAAAIRPSDRARILRALEVFTATGRPLVAWRRAAAGAPLVQPEAATRIVLAPERALIHRRIAARAAHIVHTGALAEVEALRRLHLDPDLPAMKAIGVRALTDHLNGGKTLDEAIAAITIETRRYAKRQTTWFRNQMRDWRWVSDPAALDLAGLRA